MWIIMWNWLLQTILRGMHVSPICCGHVSTQFCWHFFGLEYKGWVSILAVTINAGDQASNNSRHVKRVENEGIRVRLHKSADDRHPHQQWEEGLSRSPGHASTCSHLNSKFYRHLAPNIHQATASRLKVQSALLMSFTAIKIKKWHVDRGTNNCGYKKRYLLN